jgi:hypothetical protein
VWEAHGQFPDTGFSLWKARNTFGQGHSTYDAYRHWQLAYNWRFDAARRVAFVGVPGNEHRDSSAVGESFQFKVGDATGDGGPDVLVAFETGGSGGCADWQLLSTHSGTVRRVLSRSTCDGGVSIDHGLIQIKRAVHGTGCSIHGCGDFHRVLLRHTASSWVVVRRGIVGKPYAH